MKKRQHFTLFELLIAVGLLVMLTIVLLRMFLLTADAWSASDEQSRLYADAKTALSIISDDLENIVYQNESDAADPSNANYNNVTAPLWLEAYPLNGTIQCYKSYGGNYTAGMHMVTHSSLGAAASQDLQLFMVSYRFVPPSQTGADWPKYANGEGALLRALNSNLTFHNRKADSSMDSIFSPDTATMERAFKRVVTGVLDFQILAYPEVNADQWDDARYPADLVTSNGTRVRYHSSHSGNGQEDDKGAKGIETIQIVLTLIPPERLPGLRNAIHDKGENSQEVKEYLFKYSRTFRKTIRIKNRVSDKE